MDKLKKYSKQILTAILLCAGICCIIFGKNPAVQAGIGCTCWAVAIFIIWIIAKQKNEQELIEFEQSANEVLRDIAEKEEDSEYFGIYDVSIIDNMRAKIYKKMKKQTRALAMLGGLLLCVAIFCAI